MKGYVIELHATFAFKGENYEDAVQAIFNNIDLNETPWEDSLVKEVTEEDFNKEFGCEEE